ncbi:serine protease snake-like [Scaptodrosophila lebanonensis]|uniref:Serine protease snake-like n=1 Tax=Drosophila lebanonensis TaxID=7225 RepID=A0A6J2T8S4_DROLE|nr:serine protease snake-like [Scaptodrosophila lebanonensis]
MWVAYFKRTINVLLLVFLLVLIKDSLVSGQHEKIVSDCTSYKDTVFVTKDAFSFAFPNAPIKFVINNQCQAYTPLIYNGEPAEPKEFPHMARLGNRKSNASKIDWFCGGTLISKRFVLTAAHCFESLQGVVNVVRLGELDFARTDDVAMPEDFEVEKLIPHPNYTDQLLYHDIALIKLAKDVSFDRYKHPACLPFEDGYSFDTFVATGWGSTSAAVLHSSKLLKAQLQRFSDTNCRKEYSTSEEFPQGFDATTQICVGSKFGRDTCDGDSGGPLLSYHKDYPCMYHVMGVTSLGVDCGNPNKPGLYTRVYHYLDWITENVWSNSQLIKF